MFFWQLCQICKKYKYFQWLSDHVLTVWIHGCSVVFLKCGTQSGQGNATYHPGVTLKYNLSWRCYEADSKKFCAMMWVQCPLSHIFENRNVSSLVFVISTQHKDFWQHLMIYEVGFEALDVVHSCLWHFSSCSLSDIWNTDSARLHVLLQQLVLLNSMASCGKTTEQPNRGWSLLQSLGGNHRISFCFVKNILIFIFWTSHLEPGKWCILVYFFFPETVAFVFLSFFFSWACDRHQA